MQWWLMRLDWTFHRGDTSKKLMLNIILFTRAVFEKNAFLYFLMSTYAMHNNYQMPDGHSTEQKELVVLNSNFTTSDLKHKVEIARLSK